MSDSKAALFLRYYLNLDESQDGFKLATSGKKQLTRFFTPLVSIAIVLWGFYLGLAGVGRYYVMLGIFFLMLQAIMRYWLLPMIFKRQFVKYQFGQSEQGIELFQDHAELFSSGRPKQRFHYTEVQNFAVGKLTYMIELKNRTVVIVPKRVFASATDQYIFENTFKK
ncbi:YcxB family protein [Acinetobacter sp. WZC-1]|uniref:YcxB family protein n=1 Tax=Acinetobacter sp. WZC-1 TaxID=3459034 RepID=UPI00403DC1C9